MIEGRMNERRNPETRPPGISAPAGGRDERQAPWRRWLDRLGLVFIGCLLALVLIEGGLRIAALFFGGRSAEGIVSGKHTILTLGDSHTYGVHLIPEEAYPGQLRAELERRRPGHYQVINLGLPGMNSSQIRAQLPGWLDRYQPRTVVVCAGINNYWNTSETGSLEGWTRWVEGLRIYRLVKLAALRPGRMDPGPSSAPTRPEIQRVIKGDYREHKSTETGELLIRHEGRPEESVESSRVVRILLRDFEEIHALTQTRGVNLVLLTYAEAHYARHATVSNEMVKFARENGIAIVDPRVQFTMLLARESSRAAYFLDERDGHPNSRGYAEIADLVADAVETADGGDLP